MRYSRALVPTLKELPADAEVVSHKLMLRAGMIRQLSPGIYSMLPLGNRVIKKIERIIREEMDAADGQEVELPIVHPAELWMESGRWEKMGPELLRFKDRRGRDACLAATNEEVITDLVRRELRSYRQLPLHLYQIRVKYRDEIRPRFGVMRGREFTMEDGYTFDADEAGLDVSYGRLHQAYSNVFRRCGLEFRAVEADTGAIGGSSSHEFMVLADSGEDAVATCTACDYAANVEKAGIARPPIEVPGIPSDEASGTPQVQTGPATQTISPPGIPSDEQFGTPGVRMVPTPGARSVEDVSKLLGVPPGRVLKTLVYSGDSGQPFAVVVPGDREVNEVKLRTELGFSTLRLLPDEEVKRATGTSVGSLGPVGLELTTVVDPWVYTIHDAVTGANKDGFHLIGVEPLRDVKADRQADVRTAVEGDPCPRCGGRLVIRRGIEVGHIFKLGTKYSAAMKCTFLDAAGVERPAVMGTYGIGVGRTMAAAIEQNHDKDGIIWPVPIAPFHVILLPLNVNEAAVMGQAEALYAALGRAGVEALLDDRDERPGGKFKDADLLGIPVRVVVSEKTLKQGAAEVKVRRTGEVRMAPLAEAVAEVRRLLGFAPSEAAPAPA